MTAAPMLPFTPISSSCTGTTSTSTYAPIDDTYAPADGMYTSIGGTYASIEGTCTPTTSTLDYAPIDGDYASTGGAYTSIDGDCVSVDGDCATIDGTCASSTCTCASSTCAATSSTCGPTGSTTGAPTGTISMLMASNEEISGNHLSGGVGSGRNRRRSSFDTTSPTSLATPQPTVTPVNTPAPRSSLRKRKASSMYGEDDDEVHNAVNRRMRIEAEQHRRDELRDAYSRLEDVLPMSKHKISKVSIIDRGKYPIPSHLHSN